MATVAITLHHRQADDLLADQWHAVRERRRQAATAAYGAAYRGVDDSWSIKTAAALEKAERAYSLLRTACYHGEASDA